MPAVVNNTTNINASSVYGDVDVNVSNTTDIKSSGRGATSAEVNNKTDITASSKYGDVNVDVKNDTRMDLRDRGGRFPKPNWPHQRHCHRPPFLDHAYGRKPWA